MDLEKKCYCHRCLKERDEKINGVPFAWCRMVVCPECGDKRCPHAEDHRNACTPPHTVRMPTETEILRARVAELEREHEEDQGVIRVWRGRTKRADARVAELEEGISTAMQLIEGGFDSAAYEALEALNAHK